MSSVFTGKRIVVTGGAGGIGIETVRGFMEQGGHAIMADIDEAALERAQATLGRVRLATIASPLDTPAECARVIEAAGAPVYALVHLAGVFERDGLDPEDHGVWNRAIAANLTNAYDMAVAFSSRFDRREPARIVFASSIAYRRGSADRVPYAAAKGGIVGLTRKLSFELGPFGININAIAPSLTLTERIRPHWNQRSPEAQTAQVEATPLRRVAEASDQAKVICFLASGDADFVTGLTIDVTGGQSG